MFDYFKKIAISNRTNDELLYEYVLEEMETGIIIKGLWGKSLANSNGNNAGAKSIYMKYRVQSIKDVFTAREIEYNELTKPKLFQYIQDKILPTLNDYTNFPNTQSKTEVVENYKASEYEESIYNKVAEELSNNIRKEGLWLKAIQNTDGDENRALSLYIKYRSEAIKTEQKMAEQKRLEDAEIERKKRIAQELESSRSPANQLIIFLNKNHMRIIKEISETKVVANYNNSPMDAYLEFIDDSWIITDLY